MPKLWRHLPWLLPLILIAVVLIALLVGNIWIQGFLRSEDFRRLVDARTGSALHGEATYDPLRWEGASAFSNQLTVAGEGDSPIKSLTASQVRAEVNWRAAFSGAWRVEDITVAYMEGTFRPPSPTATPEPTLPVAPPSGLWSLLPRRFELGSLNVAQARLGFANAAGVERMSLQDSTLRLVPDGSGWALTGSRGKLVLPGYPSLEVDSFRSRIQQDAFYLSDSRLRLGDSGRITASGEFSQKGKLQLTWQQVDVSPFLNTEWKGRLTGILAGDSNVTWTTGVPGISAIGSFSLTDGLLQNVPLLEQIADFTGAPQFRRMPLQQFSGKYAWVGNQLTFTNLIAESKGLLRLEGTCTIYADKRLSGAIRVGVTSQTLQWLPGSRERVFTIPQNGYLWADVKLGGTLDNPTEDLSARLISAAKSEVIQQGVRTLESIPGPASEGARKALDILAPLIPVP